MSEIIASMYEIVKEIGSGGGGVVYLANHLRLGKKVVLKADKRKITTSPQLLRREVDVLKELSHSYIPQVYDFFIENGTVYTVIDYVEGESLDKALKRGQRFSQPQVVQWAKQMLEALCYLHSPTHGTPPRGYVHSDIKPANLMLTPEQNICLIDFNIALALGEENVIGCSAGYASPEHYGLDFSAEGETVTRKSTGAKLQEETIAVSMLKKQQEEGTVTNLEEETETVYLPINGQREDQSISGNGSSDNPSFSPTRKMIVPDIRSDIYSVGATLYHLLSGKRPSKNAKEVVPLSDTEFSPQIVKIITKAMNPNPNLRYQKAEEMLYAFTHLRENDPRLRRQKRNRLVVCTLSLICLVFGVLSAFTGLKRMQTTESWLKLAEYSQNALEVGNSSSAIDYALQALPEKQNLFQPAYVSEAQKALTDALGVYDLSDGYKTYETMELPSAPLYMAIAPDGKTAACIYAYSLLIFDTETCETIAELPVVESALAEVEYLDNDTVIYAGSEGVTAYDIVRDEKLWSGEPATAIAISGDGKSVAAVYRDETNAYVYDAITGRVITTVDFQEKHQQVMLNDTFANPNNNLFALDQNGSFLAASFDDGSLWLYKLNSEEKIIVLDESSGFTHFEGGFFEKYFAFSASNSSNSIFVNVDTEVMEQTGAIHDENALSVQINENGIYVQDNNLLVRIEPDTGEQTPLVTTTESIWRFAVDTKHTLAASKENFMFFDQNANLLTSRKNNVSNDFVQFSEGVALIGSIDSGVIRILRYENHPETEVFSYDPSYEHSEARISADGDTVTLFSYDQFRVFKIDGELLADVEIPNAEEVYDQQFIRDEDGSRLEITYYDGTVVVYSAKDGSVCEEKNIEAPNKNIVDLFETDEFRIESPLHGAAQVYDKKSGKLLYALDEDAYLTYVTQMGQYIIVQYISANDGYCYGQLLNEKCEVLAELPYLCDVYEGTLYFDYSTGNMRQSRIYDIDELIEIARTKMNGGN